MNNKTSAIYVATSFIKQYYEVLSKNPSDLYKFYNHESQFTHCDNHQIGRCVSGIDGIQKEVSGLELQGAHLDLSNGFVDAQQRGEDILVVVTGHYTPPRSSSAFPFLQTFYLSRSSTAYFVSNSVFRLLAPLPAALSLADVATNTQQASNAHGSTNTDLTYHPAPETVHSSEISSPLEDADTNRQIPTTSSQETTHDLMEREEDRESLEEEEEEGEEEDDLHCAGVDALVGDNYPVAAMQQTMQQESVTAVEVPPPQSTPSPAPVATPLVLSAVANTLKSYSDIVKKLSEAKTVSISSGGGLHIKNNPNPNPVVVENTVNTVGNGTVGGNVVGNAVGNGNGTASTGRANASAGKTPSYSIYVNQLHEDATLTDLNRVFSSFGSILSIEHVSGRSYAFLKYDSQAAVKHAVEHNMPIEILGKVVRVEERNPARGGHAEGHSGGDRPGFRRKPRGDSSAGNAAAGGNAANNAANGGAGGGKPFNKDKPFNDRKRYHKAAGTPQTTPAPAGDVAK